MEEVSWGQRLFGWQTPAALAEVNVQHETNLHNLFNQVFGSVYQLLTIIPLTVSVSVGLRALKRVRFPISCILPHADLLGLSILIGGLAVLMPYPPTELLEELVAVFVLFYSIQSARCLRSQERPS